MDCQKIFEAAFARRAELFSDPDTDCFRLLNGAAEGLDGLRVDRYGPWLLVLLEHPRLLPDAGPLCEAVARAARKLPAPVRGILSKDITRADTGCIDEVYASVLQAGAAPPAELVVRQNGIKIAVDLMGGRHTGLFLDMRRVRARLAPYYRSAGSMLNLFCYSGVFSVHGLKCGLASALNLDLAKTALERARRNYALNDIACDDRDLMYGDALSWMRAFGKKGRRFEFIVLDPPTFARGRKAPFSVTRDFPHCLELAQKLLAPGGHALTVINSPRISEKQYRDWHPAPWQLQWLEHEPEDFPWQLRPYLKAGLWRMPAELNRAGQCRPES